jgi:hypothetical protein
VYIEYHDFHLKGDVEIFRLPHYGKIARGDCSCVGEVARISARHFKVHLAVTSVGHGVFKGVMKCRKIPEEEEEGKESRFVEGRQTIGTVDVRWDSS